MTLMARLKGYRLIILAGVMTAAEALVTMGFPLPFSDQIPQWLRAAIIFLITGAAFGLRTLATRRERRG